MHAHLLPLRSSATYDWTALFAKYGTRQ